MVGGGGGNLKYATGTASFGTYAELNISGLDFKPYAVCVFGVKGDQFFSVAYGVSDDSGTPVSCASISKSSGSPVYLNGIDYFVPQDDGFKIVMPSNAYITSYTWYAIGK